MVNRLMLVAATSLLLLASGYAPADDSDTGPADKDGSIALAERLSAISHQALRVPRITSLDWQKSTALCKATTRLDPKQPRFQSALIDNLLKVGDADAALDALKAYRALQPDDQGAMAQEIELQLNHYQSADAKLNYLRFIEKQESIPKPVRSDAASRCAQLLEGRAQGREALKMVDAALQLNPLNLRAMRLKYELTQSASTAVDRVTQLVQMLRANPADPTVASRLAMQLANLGLVNPSLLWFRFSNLLYLRTGARPDRLFACGAAAEALLADRANEAADLMKEYLAIFPGDADGWFIRLSTAKYQLAQGKIDQAAYSALIRQASIGMTNLLQTIRHAAGDTSATTRPINSDTDSPLPDLSGDPARLAKSGRPELAQAYVAVVSSVAWLDLYYRRDAAAADPLLDVLTKLISPNDVQLVRLRGWRQFVGGDSDKATATLQLAAQRDPLAELGLVLIDLGKPSKHDQAVDHAKALLNAHPSLMLGATLWTELNPIGATIDPGPQSDAISNLVNGAPNELMQLVNNPAAFYTIRAEPVRAIYEFGDPILIHVLVKNLGSMDLAIGDDCAVHPDLWFDAYLRGEVEEPLTGVAVGRIDQRLVLGAGQSFSSNVRVDEDAMFSLFGQNPAQDLVLNMALVTNPAGVQEPTKNQPARVLIGPCGLRVQLTRMLERASTPVGSADERARLLERLDQGDGGEKFKTLEVMAIYVLIFRKSGTDQDKSSADDFADAIRKAQNDPNAPVHAWARYLNAFISNEDVRADSIAAMARDGSWMTRLMATMAAATIHDKALDLLSPLTSDADPIVRDYARAMSQSITAATTQPTSTSSATPAPTAPPSAP
jgi:hypothetical protein